MPVVDFLSLHVALPSQRISLLGADAISPSDRTPSEILVTHPSLALWGHERTVCTPPKNAERRGLDKEAGELE